MGPTNAFCEQLHREKYRLKGESFEQSMLRVASGLADDAPHFRQFNEILTDMRFMPGGRIQTAIGAPRLVTPYNCFVSGNIADSFVDGEGSIMHRATQAAQTMRKGGGIGYSFGTLRPRGALIKSLMSHSTGPISFMSIFNGLGDCTSSVGERRGAQMGVMPIWHPNIEEFIEAKANHDKLTRFNVSIGVTDEFMECLYTGKPFALRWGGEIYRWVDPVELWDKIMRTTWEWAEPGVLFLDRINQMNNLWYCEEIVATNPCGEQPLPPFGACLLGSFNLARYLIKTATGYTFDWDRLRNDVAAVVRAQDNVVDYAIYPLPEQEHEAKSKRRMGLGVFGLANAGEALGHPYGSADFVAFERQVLSTITRECYLASINLAKEKGAFPLFDAERYCQGKFIRTLDCDVQEMIARYGIRNSHLTSIAPTGTISQCADYVSSSIEPVFDYVTERAVEMTGGKITVRVPDYGYERLGVKGKRCRDVTVQEHLDVLLEAQKHVDSSISKTLNVPPTTPMEDFKRIYTDAYNGGAKGCTTYQLGCKRGAVLKEATPDEGQSCTINPETGERSCQ